MLIPSLITGNVEHKRFCLNLRCLRAKNIENNDHLFLLIDFIVNQITNHFIEHKEIDLVHAEAITKAWQAYTHNNG